MIAVAGRPKIGHTEFGHSTMSITLNGKKALFEGVTECVPMGWSPVGKERNDINCEHSGRGLLFNSKRVERISGPYDQILLTIQHVCFWTITDSGCQSRMPQYLSIEGIEGDEMV